MSRVLILVMAATLVASAAAAQVPMPLPQAPPRDAPQKAGTARVLGRVVAADTGRPLRKAQVRAVAPELRENRVVSTDADGKFELKELPAGRYQVSASKGSYVSLSYGQTRPFEAGKPLQISDGQTVEKVDFSLPRGAVIAGHVVDEFGEPIADARVTAMRYQYIQGRRQLTPSGRPGMTNDLGEYRIFGLPPSQYFLSASMQGAGAIVVSGMMGAGSDSGYAPTYYPGTPNVAEAQRLNVALGQTLTDINMALIPTRTARVSGTAMDSNGKPLSGGMVIAIQRSGAAMSGTTIGGQVRPDGGFTMSNMAPGDYLIMAMTPGALGDMSEFASAQVTVAGEDVNGVQLVGQKSVTATGRLVGDPTALKSLQPASLRLMAMPAHPEENMLGGIGTGKVNDDFTFEVKTRPGLSLIRFAGPIPGWALKAVRLNGVDVTDAGIEFRPTEDVAGIEVELTNQPTEVNGAVTNRTEPVKDYTVVIFSQGRERWSLTMNRHVQVGRPDQNGKYKVSGLPAGQYFAVAVDYLEPGEANDPEVLDRLKTRATSFSLADGETKTLDLKLTSAT